MHPFRKAIAALGFAAVLAFASVTPAAARTDHRSGFNDEYIFAATRGVNDMEGVHPALKLPLFPITVVLDVASLPFAVIAGFVG